MKNAIRNVIFVTKNTTKDVMQTKKICHEKECEAMSLICILKNAKSVIPSYQHNKFVKLNQKLEIFKNTSIYFRGINSIIIPTFT